MTPLFDAVVKSQDSFRSSMRTQLLEQREQIQEDLDYILDGLDEEIFENVCNVIVDRFKILLDRLEVD